MNAATVGPRLHDPVSTSPGRWVARLHRADGTFFVYTGVRAFGFDTCEEAAREGALFAKNGERVECVFLHSVLPAPE